MNVEIYVFFLRIFRKNRIFWGPLRFLYKHNHVKDRKTLTIFKKRSASKTRFLADLWPILIYSINICFFYIFQSLKSIISRTGIEVSRRIFFLNDPFFSLFPVVTFLKRFRRKWFFFEKFVKKNIYVKKNI